MTGYHEGDDKLLGLPAGQLAQVGKCSKSKNKSDTPDTLVPFDTSDTFVPFDTPVTFVPLVTLPTFETFVPPVTPNPLFLFTFAPSKNQKK